MSDSKPEDVLDLFLFEDVYNNTNHHEDEWGITFYGDNYVLYNHYTGEVVNLKVEISKGNLSQEQIKELCDDQEWDYTIDD